MTQVKKQFAFNRRTAISFAVECLFVGLMGAGVIQASAYADTPKTSTDSGQAPQPATPADSVAPQASELPAVIVKAAAIAGELPAPYAGGQLARGGSVGVLGTSNVMDQPFSTTNYTEQIIQDTQA